MQLATSRKVNLVRAVLALALLSAGTWLVIDLCQSPEDASTSSAQRRALLHFEAYMKVDGHADRAALRKGIIGEINEVIDSGMLGAAPLPSGRKFNAPENGDGRSGPLQDLTVIATKLESEEWNDLLSQDKAWEASGVRPLSCPGRPVDLPVEVGDSLRSVEAIIHASGYHLSKSSHSILPSLGLSLEFRDERLFAITAFVNHVGRAGDSLGMLSDYRGRLWREYDRTVTRERLVTDLGRPSETRTTDKESAPDQLIFVKGDLVLTFHFHGYGRLWCVTVRHNRTP
jgi:hypothetical protein